jgi:hypothetical protein
MPPDTGKENFNVPGHEEEVAMLQNIATKFGSAGLVNGSSSPEVLLKFGSAGLVNGSSSPHNLTDREVSLEIY